MLDGLSIPFFNLGKGVTYRTVSLTRTLTARSKTTTRLSLRRFGTHSEKSPVPNITVGAAIRVVDIGVPRTDTLQQEYTHNSREDVVGNTGVPRTDTLQQEHVYTSPKNRLVSDVPGPSKIHDDQNSPILEEIVVSSRKS